MGLAGLTAPDSCTMFRSTICLALLLACALAMPQEYTPAQLLVIRQHGAIAAANTPSVFETLPGWDQHQADLNAVLALQGISPGQNAHAALARVLSQESELAGVAAGRR